MCVRFCGTAEEENKHDNAGNSAEKTDIYRHWHRENKKQLTKYTHLKNANR